MVYTDIKLLKAHVRADDFTDDDDYLLVLLEAAEAAIVRWTNRSIVELLSDSGCGFKSDVQQAILLLAGHWYNQREAVSAASLSEVPYTVQALLKPHQRLGGER